MHRTVPVTTAIYQYLYPRPSPNDPSNFSNFLARHLIPEIRCETARFYGSLDTTEARYPGLNYTYKPHIRRLIHFPYHARLFRAIKVLGITDCEVLDMARWEGTLWARERFEKDEGTIVPDTTGDEIVDWVDPRLARKPTIVAVTTTTQTTVPLNRALPSPVSSTHCELEVQAPEPDRATMTASPAQIEDGEPSGPPPDATTPRRTASRRGSGPSTTLTEESYQVFEQIMSEVERIIPVLSRYHRGDPVNLPADVQAWTDEIYDRWISLQGSGILDESSTAQVRELILSRVERFQEYLPRTLNLASALSLIVEDSLRSHLPAREEHDAVAGAARETARVITQPAA